MKLNKLFSMALGALLMFNVSCRDDEQIIVPDLPKGPYENGILITNEGGFSTPTASVTFLSNDFTKQEDDIFAKNNDNATLGNVFQSVGFKGDLAYLVLNVPNKVEIVNRYTFKKSATITEQLETPRYITFANNYTYITNNDFFSTRKLNIYDQANKFVKSIDFERYAEKVVTAGGYVYVQTDGVTYDTNYNALPTGHTITRVNPSTNTVDKTITLPDDLIIKDVISDDNYVYVLTSDYAKTNVYKIAGTTGNIEKNELSDVSGGAKLALDQDNLYLLNSANKVYQVKGTAANLLFTATASYAYGFNVINGNVYVADGNFSGDSKAYIYNTSGTLLKTVTTGIGTNGFYKN